MNLATIARQLEAAKEKDLSVDAALQGRGANRGSTRGWSVLTMPETFMQLPKPAPSLEWFANFLLGRSRTHCDFEVETCTRVHQFQLVSTMLQTRH